MGNIIGGLLSPGNASGVDFQNPFGPIAGNLAGGLENFLSPLLGQLGFGGGGKAQQATRTSRLEHATGPLADYIRSTQGLAPEVGPQAAAAGQQVSALGSSTFTQLQDQINQMLSTLPEAISGAEQGLQGAEQFSKTAFDPTSQDPFFQAATNRAVQPLRAELAARGLDQGGVGAAAEAGLTSGLSTQFAQQQLGMQAQAPGILSSAASAIPSIASAGPSAVSNLFSAIPQLGQLLTAPTSLPMSQLSGLFQMLMGGVQPAQGLLAQTSPQYTPFSGPLGAFGAGGVKR